VADRAGGGARGEAGSRLSAISSFSCQENRSFDHYFGFAPGVQARGFGPPAGFAQPDGVGGRLTSGGY
jgi:hypothetical protein